MLNLDTHIVIFALTDELKPKEKRLLASNEWSISAIVLWEIAKLAKLKRINLDLGDSEVRRILSKIQILPIDLEVAAKSQSLDVKVDPADELIAATSMVHKIPLLTRDKKLRKSKLVPLA